MEKYEIKTIKEIANTQSGGTPSRKVKDYYIGDIPWVKSGELQENIITETEEKITQTAIEKSSAKLLPINTLLVAMYGANVGRVAILGIEAATNQAICAIQPKDNRLSTEYLYYYFIYYKNQLLDKAFGGAQKNISQQVIKNLEIPVPAIEEQKQIVSRIKECFTLLEKSEEKIKNLENRFSLLNKSTLNLLNIPTTRMVKIKDVAKIKGGKRLPKGQKLLDIATNHPYLRVTDFTIGGIKKQGFKYISEDVFEQIKQYTITDKDVFISIAGTIGIAGVVPTSLSGANLTENAAKLTDLDLVNNKYLALILNSPRIQAQIRKETISTTIGKLALFRIAELEIPLPSIEDQNRLVIKVESLLNKNIELKNLIIREQLRVQQLRQSILKKAFEGKLT